jgi:choline dehydrogenase-like flavoprotein
MADDVIPRRGFLKGAAGAAAATALTGAAETAQAQTPAQAPAVNASDAAAGDTYLTLTAAEAAFLSAVYDTFIPADHLSPSGTACGLVTYIDRQLAGAQIRETFNATLGASSHHTGGAVMGADPKTSAVNRYLQAWDATNLFVMGGAVFPQNAGHNPTGTIAALAYWSARAITSQYIKSPGRWCRRDARARSPDGAKRNPGLRRVQSRGEVWCLTIKSVPC